ncbi:DnaJ domain [Dillenia turbinata]|uniref:DnaJ domain n=1 Tax=Dillenia turbinata TaxID=194707 RepID=A0AAN8ZAL8_9MAGN
MPAHKSKSEKMDSSKTTVRRDPYEVLGVSRNSTGQEIKSAYRKMALKYVQILILSLIICADMFKEVTFSYNILSDPDKRRQFDTAGFEAVESESQELELDLSSLGAVNTMFAALFSKLGVPIKTSVSATVLEKALNGAIPIHALSLGHPLFRKVEKQCAHFYSVTITEEEATAGFVCRVQSTEKSKFKYPEILSDVGIGFLQLLYFDQEENGGLSLALQLFLRNAMDLSCSVVSVHFSVSSNCCYQVENSAKTGKVTSAGMYFLGFPVYRLDQTVSSSQMAAAKDPDAAFFKKLDGFQPCELTELKAGTHVFAVYGDNFFKSASYTIEALCAATFSEEKDNLRTVEAKILSKRAELSKFEAEYREVLAQFTEMTRRYAQEMQAIDNLLKQRNEIHASYTTGPPLKQSNSKTKIKSSSKGAREDGEAREKRPSTKDRPKKKRWYNIHLKVDKRKPC